MANLNENPAVFSGGIYQIEMTDPVLGGVPNVDTGAGMSNIPHLQLANRTAFLKKVIDDTGLGAAAVPLVTLNSAAARLTGSYRFASTDANTPAAGVAGTVEVIAASASAVNQMASDSASSRMFTRFWNGTVWSAWSEIWRTTGVAESVNNPGWQRLPSGMILQWGQNTVAANSNQTITFPIAFPFFCFSVVAMVGNTTGDLTTQFTAQLRGLTATTLTLRNIGATNQEFLWQAIGR